MTQDAGVGRALLDRPRARARLAAATRPLLALAGAVVVWEAIVRLFALPPFILPGPARVGTAMWDNAGLIAAHAAITAAEVGLGLLFGVALGIATALSLALSPAARLFVRPMLVASQALPVFALAPILTLWLGFGMASKVLMAVLIIYFPVASAFFDGLMRTPPMWLDQAQTMGASPRSMLWRVRVPAAIPSLASGLRLAAVYAPIGAVIGEWVGSAGGLGYLMLLANGRAKTDLMFATLVVLAVLTLLLHRGVGAGCDALLRRMT